MNKYDYIETPRQRMYRLINQIKHWKCYGYSRISSEQDICTMCQHFSVFEQEAACSIGADGGKESPILHCRKFKAFSDWHYFAEHLLNDVMADVIQDMCKRETESVHLPKVTMEEQFNGNK